MGKIYYVFLAVVLLALTFQNCGSVNNGTHPAQTISDSDPSDTAPEVPDPAADSMDFLYDPVDHVDKTSDEKNDPNLKIPRFLNFVKSERNYMIGLPSSFLSKLIKMPQAEVLALRKVLRKHDILLLPIQKMATPEDIDKTVSLVAAKFPQQRLFIYPYASRASLMFEPNIWKNFRTADDIKGVWTSTLTKLDGVLIDHEVDAYCHQLDENEENSPDHVKFNKLICSNPRFPRLSADRWENYEEAVAYLKPLVKKVRHRFATALDKQKVKKRFFVGLIPSGVALRQKFYNNAQLMYEAGADGQIIQTQKSCRISADEFEDQIDRLISQYQDQAVRVVKQKLNRRPLYASNLGVQITIGEKMNSENAIVDLQRAEACVQRAAQFHIRTILLFHMEVEYMLQFMNRMNRYRKM